MVCSRCPAGSGGFRHLVHRSFASTRAKVRSPWSRSSKRAGNIDCPRQQCDSRRQSGQFEKAERRSCALNTLAGLEAHTVGCSATWVLRVVKGWRPVQGPRPTVFGSHCSVAARVGLQRVYFRMLRSIDDLGADASANSSNAGQPRRGWLHRSHTIRTAAGQRSVCGSDAFWIRPE